MPGTLYLWLENDVDRYHYNKMLKLAKIRLKS
jgi:hypothetical protein